MSVAVVLGLLQGLTEWLPVSSEGVIAAAYSLMTDGSFADAVAYALWLHAGTALAAIIMFRQELVGLTKELFAVRTRPSPMLLFLILATITSAGVAIPLLIGLQEISSIGGAVAMGVVGAFMLVTGYVQLRRRAFGVRTRDSLGPMDAILTGIAQGVAAIPGLSRSGLTVATLLGRGVQRKEALVISFLMSIPASLGAALFAVLDNGFDFSPEHIVGLALAFVVGLLTLRFLLAVTEKINLGAFVIFVGLLMVGGALFEVFR
ncbi:MAG: undecaprenyl-diphosphate phosphatase [Chloroflexi bacterium]|nr:undecaprenyl-diphosphate phosphatase [Chloroflexota bacterium]